MRREREAPVVCAVLCLVAAAAAVAACGKLCAASKTRRSATPSAGDAAGSTGSETQLTCLTAVEESLQSQLLLSPWRALSVSPSRSVPLWLFPSLSLALFAADHPQRLFAAGVAVAALLSRSGCNVKCRLN